MWTPIVHNEKATFHLFLKTRRNTMTQLMETIKNRRSIRKYEDRDIPEEMMSIFI
jgi:hypothetical protein